MAEIMTSNAYITAAGGEERRTMTLLDALIGGQEDTIKALCWVRLSEIRRALAIAQVADEMSSDESYWTVRQMLRRADELLAEKRP